jgi:hypothetical protein
MPEWNKVTSSLRGRNYTQQYALVWVILNFVNFVFIEIFSAFSELKKQNVFVLNLVLVSAITIYLVKNHPVDSLVKLKNGFFWQKIMLVIVFFGSFISGYAVSPNNWDSMTYHLGRVLHWYQNGSLNHFSSTVSRQNYVSPFGDFQSLAILSSGSDRFAFLPSFISGIIIISIFSAICTLLKIPRTVIYAGIFLILAPNFVSQISTTQVDLRSLAFVMSGLYLLIQGGSLSTFMGVIAFGLSFGTKFLALLPLVGVLFIPKLRLLILNNLKKDPKSAALGFLLGVIVNLPWLFRNYGTFGNFTGESGHIFALNSNLDLRAIDLIRYFSTNILYYRIPQFNNFIVEKTNNLLSFLFGSDQSLIPFGLNISTVYPIATEDDVSSSVLFVTLFLIFLLLIFKRQFRNSLIFISPLALTFIILSWQPWINRLLVPSFVFMVLFGVYFVSQGVNEIFRRTLHLLSIVSILTSCLYIIDSDRRGLSGIVSNPTNRITDYFIPRPGLEEDYRSISEFLESRNARYASTVGMEDSWEYPLLVMNQRVNFVPVDSDLLEYGVCLDSCETLDLSSKSIVLKTKNGLLVYVPKG